MHWKTSALLVLAFILAGFSYLAAAGEGKDAAIKKDRKALQGTWKTDKDNMAGITSMRFDGEKFTMTFQGTITATVAAMPLYRRDRMPAMAGSEMAKVLSSEIRQSSGPSASAPRSSPSASENSTTWSSIQTRRSPAA